MQALRAIVSRELVPDARERLSQTSWRIETRQDRFRKQYDRILNGKEPFPFVKDDPFFHEWLRRHPPQKEFLHATLTDRGEKVGKFRQSAENTKKRKARFLHKLGDWKFFNYKKNRNSYAWLRTNKSVLLDVPDEDFGEEKWLVGWKRQAEAELASKKVDFESETEYDSYEVSR